MNKSLRRDETERETAMNEHDKIINNVIEGNVAKVMSDDRFPRLRSDFGLCVLAKTHDGKRCLVGGLGALGVGQSWSNNEDGHCNDYAGFDTAPIGFEP